MACHFLKDKKISNSLRRRFQFWLLSALAFFTSPSNDRLAAWQRVLFLE
jgi:hypothetical protein